MIHIVTLNHIETIIRRPGEACTVFLLLCRIQNLLVILHPNFFIPPTSKSKIQNPQNPKSKIPKTPKIQNPKSKIPEIWGHIKICYITVQNPNFFGRFWGFWILDFGFRPQNPKSKIPKAPKSKIQNPQDPKSKIPKIQNPKSPKSKIRNPQDPKSKIPKIPHPKSSAKIPNLRRWGPHIKNCYITIQNPRSKIQNPKSPNCGFCGFWILEFGFGGFWILDCGILDFGDFGVWILGILDFGDFGFW